MTSAPPSPRPNPRVPRWVKIGAVAAVIVIVLLVLGILVGGDRHGPGRHVGSAALTATVLAGCS